MKEIKRLKTEDLKILYERQMKQDFPPEELRPLSSMIKLMTSGAYMALGYFIEGKQLAYALIAFSNQETVLLDFFAVKSGLRGKGIGADFLEMLSALLQQEGRTGILIEVENPDFASSDSERLTRLNRIRFYEKTNCKMTSIRSSLFGVEFNIMYRSLGEIKQPVVNLAETLVEIYRTILAPYVYTSEAFDQVVCVEADTYGSSLID